MNRNRLENRGKRKEITMKVLGLSFGKKNANTDILVKKLFMEQKKHFQMLRLILSIHRD